MALTRAHSRMIDGIVVDVKSHGAVGDGTTNDTSAFTAAIEELNTLGGGTLLIPPGDYKAQIIINHSNIRVSGYGATVGFGIWETLTVKPTLGATNLAPFLGFDTGTETPNSVAAGATFYDISSSTIGDDEITLASVSGLSVGDTCVVISEEVTSGSTTVTNFVPRHHQIVNIIGISGSDVTLSEPINATISGATTYAFLIKWDFVSNIKIEGVTFNNLYGASYATSFSGVIGLTLENVVFKPESAWGAFVTCRGVNFTNCEIKDAYSGFSNGRMCDDISLINCVVTCNERNDSGTSQRYFYFCEENINHLTIQGCRGIDAGFAGYIGSSHTNISISNSVFDMSTTGYSAFRATTFQSGSRVSVSDCIFTSHGGISSSPYEENPNAVVAIAYTAGEMIFTNCSVSQLASGVEFGYNHGSVVGYSETKYISSLGIKLPDTDGVADGNTLDSYEEGTFVPTLLGTTTNPTQSYVTQEGTYTRVGDTVFFQLYISLQGAGITPGTGNAYISGLPFDVPDDLEYEGSVSIYSKSWQTTTYGAPTMAKTVKNTDTIELFVYNNDAGAIASPVSATAGDCDDHCRVIISGHYRV
jgi:hypothetical protein